MLTLNIQLLIICWLNLIHTIKQLIYKQRDLYLDIICEKLHLPVIADGCLNGEQNNEVINQDDPR